MYELLIVACVMTANGEPSQDCREIRGGLVEGYVDQLSCRKMGMIEAARWIGDHPSFIISRIYCGAPGTDT